MKKGHTKTVTVHRAKPVTHRKKRRSRRGLSAGMSATSMMNSAKAAGGAAIGGYLGGMINGMLPEKIGTLGRIGIGVLIGIGANQFLNMPNLASGTVGGFVALNNPTKGLSEFAAEDTLSEEPMYLSEDGEPLMLSEDGEFYYAG